jgi:4-diphosphocytidyl-2-C-methyl-D-erythritol kinase
MINFPSAKINLGLNVLFKRDDGYHELETLMIQLPFHDVLEILPASNFDFIQSGIKVEGDMESNLCVKAFRLIQENHSISNVYMHLEKIIPMGAGLGGGSADAAFVLRALDNMFELNLPDEKLQGYAAQLGSDCPFFIIDKPQIAKGRGEILSTVDFSLKGYYLKLINVGIHVSTKEAFSAIEFSKNEKSIEEIIHQPIQTWKSELKNDFETTVFEIYPELAKIKENLYSEGAIYASMSGSGSTMYGIFENEPLRTYQSIPTVLEKIMKF